MDPRSGTGQALVDTPSAEGRKKDGWRRGTVEQRQSGRGLKHTLLPTYFATLGAVPLPGLLRIMMHSVRLTMPTWPTEERDLVTAQPNLTEP